MHGCRSAAAAATLLGVLVLAAPAGAATTTVQRTIQDCDGNNLLEMATGEAHVSLGEIPPPSATTCQKDTAGRNLRLPNKASLLNFVQLTDFQLADEESPGRLEFLDTTQRDPSNAPFNAAYRPQESLAPQIVEAMVEEVRNTTSPVTGAKLDFTILTGDNADSEQLNETRWFIDILDGTTGGGNPDPEMTDATNGRKINPDSGIESLVSSCQYPPGFTGTYKDNGSIYDGVRGGGGPGQDTGYYNPDGNDDGDGYTPDRARNLAETGSPRGDVTVRDFPGLFEAAQRPFEAVGLGMPWYSAFGNHDALIQGNSPQAYAGPLGAPTTEKSNPAFDGPARGCLKPTKPPADLLAFASNPAAHILETDPVVVPPDPRRCYVAKDEPNDGAAPCNTGGWIQQHSRTTGTPVGHGFEPFGVNGQTGEGRPPQARAAHDGYYAFKPKPGFRFIVLDTITDACGGPFCSEGSVDDAQFRWMEGQLNAADAANEIALVFSHHTERTTRQDSFDVTEQPIHFGERFDRKGGGARPVRPDSPGDTLEDLFCRHKSVVGHVDGHEHDNYVLKHNCEDPGQGTNKYLEVSTGAHIDWPQQARMIEFVNDGGQLTLVLTMIDHNGAANPGAGNANAGVQRLASIGREIAYNDYQNGRGSRGARADRNVIVPLGRSAPAAR